MVRLLVMPQVENCTIIRLGMECDSTRHKKCHCEKDWLQSIVWEKRSILGFIS
uniref:Uncharacterized protein n=1 Tax=Anguilla anguilla TaxID=7936 RepID=A0A0E9P8H3_ANGAN